MFPFRDGRGCLAMNEVPMKKWCSACNLVANVWLGIAFLFIGACFVKGWTQSWFRGGQGVWSYLGTFEEGQWFSLIVSLGPTIVLVAVKPWGMVCRVVARVWVSVAVLYIGLFSFLFIRGHSDCEIWIRGMVDVYPWLFNPFNIWNLYGLLISVAPGVGMLVVADRISIVCAKQSMVPLAGRGIGRGIGVGNRGPGNRGQPRK
jgi:hypothetical protein